jgi:methylated-DNA-[protein]-cysteine S-methyltransferase
MTKRNPKKRILSEEVYSLVSKIPRGGVATYGDIASALGNPKAARAIGAILRANPNPIVVPCHRVVHHDGKVGGYAYGVEAKKDLLKKEGMIIHNNILQDLDVIKTKIK